MKKALVFFIVCAVLCFAASTAIAAPVSHSNQASAVAACEGGHHFFAKTKFAAHMLLATGVFYKWIYKPFRAGAFKAGAPGRTKALVKAGVSALLVVHWLHEACKNAQAAGGTLAKVVVPISALETQLSVLAAKLKSGHFKTSDVLSAQTAVTAVAGG